MLREFIRNIFNSSLSCAENLRDRNQARFESHTHGDFHSRPDRGPVLSVLLTLPPTPPVSAHCPSDADIHLSSIVDIDSEGSVYRGKVPSRFARATFEDMPEELHCHILGFLSYNEIICCALTCQMMYTTVQSSAELQYIIELGSQKLIEVHPRPPTVSFAECLHILRQKANAWNTFSTSATDVCCFTSLLDFNSVVHRNVISTTPSVHVDPASNAVDFETYTTCTVQVQMDSNLPHTYTYFEQPQDLKVIVTLPVDVDTDGFEYEISFRTISTGEEHPLSHGSCVVSGRAAFSEAQDIKLMVAVLDDRLAVYVAGLYENRDPCWSLHVSSWQRRSETDDLYAIGDGNILLDIRFLVREKLIALSTDGQIHLYDTTDPSKPPRLHARFMMPVYGKLGDFDHPVIHNAASCAGLVADDHWIWTTNPADRVISVTWACPWSVFIISARIFFIDIPPTWFDATSYNGRSVPWSSWGPQNSRLFPGENFGREGLRLFGIGGSRVIWTNHYRSENDSESLFRLHMTDFNPSTVARGIGEVHRKPTTSVGLPPNTQVTTYLPFVEVEHDKDYDACIWDIKLDEESMVMFTQSPIESEWEMQADFFAM